MTLHPIEGEVVLMSGAKASVTLRRLSTLLSQVQDHLGDRIETYDRQYECIEVADSEAVYYLADPDHWETVGETLGFSEREVDAVCRAHETQFEREGRRLDRSDEFEASLEIRAVVAISLPATSDMVGQSDP